jgi:hypothetical protein
MLSFVSLLVVLPFSMRKSIWFPSYNGIRSARFQIEAEGSLNAMTLSSSPLGAAASSCPLAAHRSTAPETLPVTTPAGLARPRARHTNCSMLWRRSSLPLPREAGSQRTDGATDDFQLPSSRESHPDARRCVKRRSHPHAEGRRKRCADVLLSAAFGLLKIESTGTNLLHWLRQVR